MAWNGSDNSANTSSKSTAPHRASPLRGLAAGLIVILGGGIAAWWFLGRAVTPVTAVHEKTGGKIATVQHVTVTNRVAANVEKPDPNARPTKVGEKLNGYIMLPSGKLHKIKGEIYNNSALSNRAAYAVFDYSCENEIAALLTMKPGETLVGTPHYNGRFKEEFLESLKHPIVNGKDDSDEIKELRSAVTDAKIVLKDALDRGEDIEKMMSDARRELQDLAAYKQALKGELMDISRTEGMSVEDMEDYVSAANKMLESKGIAPLKFGPLVRRKLQLELEQSQGNKKK